MTSYFETEIGRFSMGLVRDDGQLIAVTCVDSVHVKNGYQPFDDDAIEAFANKYNLPVRWLR